MAPTPPADASTLEDDSAVETWKESAGRPDGQQNYQFGDVSRILLRRSSEGLEEWSNAPKTREGYQFGDLFLKGLVRGLLNSAEAESTPEVAGDEDESAEHRALAASLLAKRQNALDLIEEHLPRIEQWLQEMQGKQELDALQSSAIWRVKVGGLQGAPSPLETFRRCLEDIKASFSIRLDGGFVRIAETCGDLAMIQKSLDDALKVAEQCTKCANDVCPRLADAPAGTTVSEVIEA